MRAVLALAATLISTAAFADSLPITGDYGSDAGCATPPPYTVDNGSDLLRLTPTAMNGLEWSCAFGDVTKNSRGFTIAASCTAGGTTKPLKVTIIQYSDGTITYKAKNGRFNLHRCKPS